MSMHSEKHIIRIRIEVSEASSFLPLIKKCWYNLSANKLMKLIVSVLFT
jgi:hypothetical protein